MAYEDLKSTANQISNQSSANLGTFTSQASPLQTDVIGKMFPINSQPNTWVADMAIKNDQVNKAVTNTWKEFISPLSNSTTNYAQDHRSIDNLDLSVSESAKNLTGLTQGNQGLVETTSPNPPSWIDKDKSGDLSQRELNRAAWKINRQENRQKRQEAQKEWQGSAEGQAAMNNIPSGTGNTFVDSFNAFSAMEDAPKFSDTGGGTKAFMSSKTGLGISGAANAAASVVGGLADAGISFDIGRGNYNDRSEAQQLNETQESVRQGIYKGVSMIPGWGPLISAGLQLTDGLGKMLGTQMSNISKDAAEDAGLSRGFNNVVATIPGLGSVLGAFTKKTDEFEVDRERLAGVGSAYDMSTFDSAEDLSGGLFLGQRGKVNDFIAEQNRLRDTMTSISDTQKLRKEGASAAAADLAQQNKNRYSGLTGGQMAIGKKGMKLDLSWARGLLSKFQKGGKLGTPGIESNVIVEGAYHAHKNHLNEVNPELSDMTPKGIPVATEDASGNKTQVAEIEVGELILTKDLTDKLEELYKDGSDDAAIQAGILFAEEIIDNTVDNKGGVLDEE